ncbi:MAG: hypothetical protein AB1505_15840 [Candidatus Latescibacterota bacterium]
MPDGLWHACWGPSLCLGTQALVCLAGLALAGLPAAAQEPVQALTPEEVALAETQLRQALAGPRERAFLQVLAEARVVPALPADTVAAYDLLVRYNPDRYRDPRVGLYPLSFEDQFVGWGKRVAVFTRAVAWPSRRFFLYDVSTGREAWISTEEARTLYQPAGKLPGKGAATFGRWLPLIHAASPRTDLRTLGRWLRAMRLESRDGLVRRLQVQAPAAAP